MRYRKRQKASQSPTNEKKRIFCDIRRQIAQGSLPAALHQLDQLAASSALDGWESAQILRCVGYCELAKNNTDAACELFHQAKTRAQRTNHSRYWLEPALEEIRALIRVDDRDTAHRKIAEVWHYGEQQKHHHDQFLRDLPGLLQKNGEVEMPPRPVRSSVILRKLGRLLESEGQLGDARYLYEQAVLLTPRGASRVRQYLARLALNEGRLEEAERYARESIHLGKFQAKTVASWPLLLKARHERGLPPLQDEMEKGLFLHGEGVVKARSVLMICRSLREFGDVTWKDVAGKWLRRESKTDPVVSMEIVKLLLTDAKVSGGPPREILRLAVQVLVHPLSSPQEMIAASKDVMRYNLLLRQQAPDIQALTRRIRHRHGEVFVVPMLHGLGLSAMLAKRHDIGRDLMKSILTSTNPVSQEWGKAQMALGKMESALGRHEEAVAAYMHYAENLSMPDRFRLHALMKSLQAMGHLPDTRAHRQRIDRCIHTAMRLLEPTSDFKIWLEACRQASLSGALLMPYLPDLVKGAQKRVASALASTECPGEKTAILRFYFRKLYYDLHRNQMIIRKWNTLEPAFIEDMNRQGGSAWWELQSLVAGALLKKQAYKKAEKLLSGILDDPHAPAEAFSYFAHAKLEQLLQTADMSAALSLADEMVHKNPTHKNSAPAYYWIALRALAEGRHPDARRHLLALRTCFANKPALYREQELDLRAILILRETFNMPIDDMPYQSDFITEQKAAWAGDLAKLL